ncbi:MAG TPA: aspartate--ammonia ligase [Actinobacteria bacterium]|nr:aspartate--ammonia ligase [bacterium BMS3Bbin01]HDH27098.1 aspartate--ammonia ligase [Actinomycetota bacterium]
MSDKTADLAGPGIGTYEEVENILPTDYRRLLAPRETMAALFAAKQYIEDNLSKELNLMMVQVPLIVDVQSGVNDMLDRDGSRTPVQFHISNDHDHSAYVDQWDWERVITAGQRNLAFLTDVVKRIWSVLVGANDLLLEQWPQLRDDRYPPMPRELTFLHAEDILDRYPELPRKQRETAILQEYPAIFIYGIGWTLADGYPHEMRAADYDDWITPTVSADGRPMHGLNGDILVWNPVTRRRHELTSMGIRVTKETLVQQLEMTGQMDFLELPYHKAILNDEIPLSIGGGIGQSRTYMYLLRKAHLGEVSVTVWPQILKDMCAKRGIFVLE